jgi:ribosomal protein S18 acetylase RimI-like enzyme
MEPISLAVMKRIEETSLNAWPALRQILYDGWLCRFAAGYTRRANSINPIYPGSLNVAEKIARSEQLYRARQLRPIFKITPFVEPANLDGLLDQAGYQLESLTSVQVTNLAAIAPPAAAVTRCWETPAPAWVDDYMRMNQVSAANRPALQGILANIVPSCCFMTLNHQEQTVACGLGVLEGRYVGLFDIVTDPVYRGQGFGSKLMMAILNWAKTRGAQQAYLQVMLNNQPALKLYAKLGFREIYQYWYRTQP